MTAAVIDLGTNTFHLIIAEQHSAKNEQSNTGGMNVLYKTNLPVRLGQGRINENIIIPEAFERGLSALQEFAETIRGYNVDVVKATATSAVRSARNGDDFVRAAKESAGIDIEVISGDQEAEFIFKGVQASGMIQGTCLVMDIGGGSTEFILCKEDEVLWKKSYNIGAARLTQAFFKSDPLSRIEAEEIFHHLVHTLPELLEQCSKLRPTTLIGSAGAFESFANILMAQQAEANQIHVTSSPIDVVAYRALRERLIQSSHEERLHIEGLIPLRVDMIVIASLLVNFVLDHTGISNLSLSTNDLKFGVLQAIFQE
jgi:exopolyphosphatase/guanosine-5'-triphosphate,3'-diphosphate pyrophosphatase